MENKTGYALGLVVVFVVSLVLSAIWKGYVLSVIWGWFAVPTFGLPPLSLVPAIGISYIIGFLTCQYNPPRKDDKSHQERFQESVLFSFIYPLLILGLSAAVNIFM